MEKRAMTKREYDDMRSTARARAAQAWCTEATRNIEMDTRLAEAFAEILVQEWGGATQKLVKQLQAQLVRCEEVASFDRAAQDARPGDSDWSEALRKVIKLHNDYKQERKRNSDLVSAGRRSVDTDVLFNETYHTVMSTLSSVAERLMVPLTTDFIASVAGPELKKNLAALIVPYEKENRTSFLTKWDEYVAWRTGVDEVGLLDEFDLALGWFAGQGFSHKQACEAARMAVDNHSLMFPEEKV